LIRVHFVSSNPNKVREVERVAGIEITPVAVDLTEVQAGTLEEIASRKLAQAVEAGRLPVAVEDVALGFVALGGFPGPYVKWLLESAGGAGLGRIARGLDDRRAVARCCVAFSDGLETKIFVGETPGAILLDGRGDRNFGWDPWFLPEGSSRTYAEMSGDEKDRISHRSRAWSQLAQYLGGK